MAELRAGLCKCGCGKTTTIAIRGRKRLGYKAGEYLPYFKNHSPHCFQARRDYKKNAVKKGKELVAQYLTNHPCLDCGESDPIVLQLHHINPAEKKGSLSDLITRGHHSVSVLNAEIAKCEVLCANCHLKRHAKDNWNAMRPFAKFRAA